MNSPVDRYGYVVVLNKTSSTFQIRECRTKQQPSFHVSEKTPSWIGTANVKYYLKYSE